jgi:hypothetical protein
VADPRRAEARIEPGGREWAGLFAGFTASAFRYEARQSYDVPAEAESIARFGLGGDVGVYPAKAGWLGVLSMAADRGAKVTRVHSIRVPGSPYVRWELASYAANAAAGEDIRLIPWTGKQPRWQASDDFWLFDGQVVLRMRYNKTGRLIRARVSRDDVSAGEARLMRERLLGAAVPYEQYTGAPAGRPVT